MSFLEYFSKTKTEISQKVIRESKGTGETLRLKKVISDNDQKINKLYAEIGEAYYMKQKEDPEPFLKEMVEEVSKLYIENNESRRRISVLNGKIVCLECGFANLSDAKFCSECGTKLPTSEPNDSKTVQKGRICPGCGAKAEEDMRFCMNCGTLLEEKRQSSTMEAEPQQEHGNETAKTEFVKAAEPETLDSDEIKEAGAVEGEEAAAAEAPADGKESAKVEVSVAEEESALVKVPVVAEESAAVKASVVAEESTAMKATAEEEESDTVEVPVVEEGTVAEKISDYMETQSEEQETEGGRNTENVNIRKCSACGTVAEKEDVFCIKCGKLLEE